MNVLFISPQRTVAKDQPYAPLGIISIASVLRKKGYAIKIYDREISSKSISEVIKSFEPDLVGISAYTGKMLKDAAYVSKVIKESTNAFVVWGGVHPSLLREETLENEFIDFIIAGEGEYPMLNLLNTIRDKTYKYGDIKGLGYKRDDKLFVNESDDFIDLTKLPIPAWDLLDVGKYYQNWAKCKRLLRIYSSKGCPGKCGFCYNNSYHKSIWRGKDVHQIIEEIKYLIKNFNVDGIGFTDDLFTGEKERLSNFCKLLIDNKIEIGWFCNARVGLDRDVLQMMKTAGCKCIYFGIETGSPRMLKFINKGINITKIKETMAMCKELDINTVGSFMLGFPTEEEEDIKHTVNLAIELKPTYYDFSIFMCYPGTKLYDYCVENNLFENPNSLKEWVELSSWDEAVRNFSKITKKELQILCDFFTLKNVVNSIKNDKNTISGYLRFNAFISAVTDVLKMYSKYCLNRSIVKKYNLRLLK